MKIIVEYTSPSRPDHMVWGNMRRGVHNLFRPRCGTGTLNDTPWSTSASSSSSPPPPSSSQSAATTAGDTEFLVGTAAHVVAGDDEVKETKVELFFDKDGDRSGVVRARGVRLIQIDVLQDYCNFTVCLENKCDEAEVLRRLAGPVWWKYPTTTMTMALSHPHGVAKRFTCGSPGDVTFGYTANDDVSKSLCRDVCKAESLCGVSEKTFLCFWLYCVSLEREISSKSPLGFTQHEMKTEIMKYLITNGLVVYPKQEKVEKLYETFSNIYDISDDLKCRMSNEREEICPQVTSVTSPTRGQQHSYKIPKYSSCVTSASNSSQKIGEDLATRYNEVDREWRRKHRELLHGRYAADTYAGDIRVNYNLDLCPGSSGCQVMSFIVEEGQRYMVHYTPHSRAQSEGVGASGVGNAFYD